MRTYWHDHSHVLHAFPYKKGCTLDESLYRFHCKFKLKPTLDDKHVFPRNVRFSNEPLCCPVAYADILFFGIVNPCYIYTVTVVRYTPAL